MEKQTIQQWLDHAGALAQRGRFDEALQALQKVIDANPRHVPLREHIVGLAIRLGHYQLAIDHAMVCAELQLELGQREQAIHRYESILRMEETVHSPDQVQEVRQAVARVKAEIYFQIGEFQRENGKLDLARQYLSKAVELAPGLARFHLGLARLYQSKELYKDAIGEYQEVIRMASDDNEAMAHAYEGLGELFCTQGRPPQATTTWLMRAAECFEQAGHGDQARRVYARLLEVDPQCQEALQKLKSRETLPTPGPHQDEFGARLRQLEMALLERPDDLSLLNAQGDCLLALNRLSEAAATFERVLHLLEPHQLKARQNLVRIYHQAGQSALAAQHENLLRRP